MDILPQYAWAQPLSRRAQMLKLPVWSFTGVRIECEECVRSFTCFRADETHCGACRHLKEAK